MSDLTDGTTSINLTSDDTEGHGVEDPSSPTLASDAHEPDVEPTVEDQEGDDTGGNRFRGC